ncbi:uncharacterized protein [Nicotiana tomentosiformis]|uniref:uncharacterized protein n=1 Tax=Nicotiana tomentosiformis TaxID=4098 RepID=UPI00388C6D6A
MAKNELENIALGDVDVEDDQMDEVTLERQVNRRGRVPHDNVPAPPPPPPRMAPHRVLTNERYARRGSGLNNKNDPFKNELLWFMREVNARMDQISGAPPVLKGLDLKKYTQLSYKQIAAPELIPKWFKMSEVSKYDRTSDPQEHISTYKMAVKGNDLAPHKIKSVLLKKFGETFTRGARTWYSLLPEHYVDSFEMPMNSFIKAHAGARKVQAQKADIFRIVQGESELLREFVTQFQKNKMFLPVVPDEWEAEAFTKGLNLRSSNASWKLKEILLEFQAITWVDVHNRYESKITIKDDQRDPNLWCEYYGTNGHRTGDCRHLWKEVATLLKKGHLREFLSDRAKKNYGRNRDNVEPSKAGEEPPRQTINMIFGRNEINGVTFLAMKKMKVSITHSKRFREDNIPFTEEDADGLLFPHNDALVISLNVLDFKIKRVLVDSGSSDNIIQWRVLEKAKLTGSIILATKLLVGFSLVSVTTRGEILLLTNTEGVMKTTLFKVVDGD